MTSTLNLNWTRLVKAQTDKGEVYGDLVGSDDTDSLLQQDRVEIRVLTGDNPLSLETTNETVKVQTSSLVGPLAPKDVPLVKCIGLNYGTHIKETGHALPENPTVFIKPAPTVCGPGAVTIPKIAQQMLDYEGELCILIGRQGKNISADQALSHVAGFLVGNDVSARDWQTQPAKAGGRPQWCFGKSFDEFAPVGPVIVSPSLMGDCKNSTIQTHVDGDERQKGRIDDLVFGVKELIAFLSQGQTLEKGTLIMTGTPGGVGLFMEPKTFLQDGQMVTVSISGLGALSNQIKFE